MIIIIELNEEYGEINDKRFHLPYTLIWICPNCKTKHKENLNHDYYLTHPKMNIPFPYTLYCGKCDDDNKECEFEIKLRLNISLEMIE